MSNTDSEGALKILVADDSRAIRKILRNLISKTPFDAEISEATDGRNCAEMLCEGQFDVAFIDIHMPDKNGLEALAEARRAGCETFVVVMSGDAADQRFRHARDLRAYEFLKKPFTEAAVLETLNNYKRISCPTPVLVVDDCRTVRRVICRVLSSSHFHLKVEAVDDGESALEAYRQRHHELVFLDINMPNLSGVETLSMLREINSDVKVVFVTGDRRKSTRDEVMAAGADGLLLKPFFPDAVDKILHEVHGMESPELARAAKEHARLAALKKKLALKDNDEKEGADIPPPASDKEVPAAEPDDGDASDREVVFL